MALQWRYGFSTSGSRESSSRRMTIAASKDSLGVARRTSIAARDLESITDPGLETVCELERATGHERADPVDLAVDCLWREQDGCPPATDRLEAFVLGA